MWIVQKQLKRVAQFKDNGVKKARDAMHTM